MSPLRRSSRPTLLAAFLTTISGCVVSGVGGNLGFAVRAPDNLFGVESAHAPVAQGSEIVLGVHAPPPVAETEPGRAAPGVQAIRWSSLASSAPGTAVFYAETSDSNVVAVLGVEPQAVKLRAVGRGVATVIVTTERGRDALPIVVEPIHTITLTHWTTAARAIALEEDVPMKPGDLAHPVFLRGGVARLLATARAERGETLVGLGADPAGDIAVVPTGAAVVTHAPGDLDHVDVRLDSAGTIFLTGKNGATLGLRVIEPTDLTSLVLLPLSPLRNGKRDKPTDLPVGRSTMIVARGTVGGEGERLLLGDVIDVRTTTPDVCTVNDDDDRLRLGDGATQVKGKAIGRCVLDARVGEVAAALELDVVP